MGNWRIRGHRHAIRMVEQAFRAGRFPHAYLLVGPPHVGKATLALRIAQMVNCPSDDPPCGVCNPCRRIEALSHPDVCVVSLERPLHPQEVERVEKGARRREISINDAREMQRLAGLRPYEGGWRVFILEGAEHLSTEASNSLLKVLEEPPSHVLFLLVTAREEDVLPTLRSRCQRLELRPLPLEEVEGALLERGAGPEQARRLARLSRGAPGRALALYDEPSLLHLYQQRVERVSMAVESDLSERFRLAGEMASLFYQDPQALREWLLLWAEWWRDLLMVRQGLEDLVTHGERIEALRRQAEALSRDEILRAIRAVEATHTAIDANVNPRLALEALVVSLPRVRTPAGRD